MAFLHTLLSLSEKKTYHQVLDELKREVDDLEPFIVGYDQRPSTAFTILVKLFTMKLTKNQLQGMLAPKASPFAIYFILQVFIAILGTLKQLVFSMFELVYLRKTYGNGCPHYLMIRQLLSQVVMVTNVNGLCVKYFL